MKLPCGLTPRRNNSLQRRLSHHFKVFAAVCVPTGFLLWITAAPPLPQMSSWVKESRGGVKVPQMLCPHKLRAAGLEEVRPALAWVRREAGYVRRQQCSCLITLESINNSLSQDKRMFDPAGHRGPKGRGPASAPSPARARHRWMCVLLLNCQEKKNWM